jgi:hypothetical protein
MDVEERIVTDCYEKAAVRGDDAAIDAVGILQPVDSLAVVQTYDRHRLVVVGQDSHRRSVAAGSRLIGGGLWGKPDGNAIDSQTTKLVVRCRPRLRPAANLFDDIEHVAT